MKWKIVVAITIPVLENLRRVRRIRKEIDLHQNL